MKLPKEIDIRTAIVLFILAVVLTISGASILFGRYSKDSSATGYASVGSVGLSFAKPADDGDDEDEEEEAPPEGPPGPGSVGGAGGGGGGGGGGGSGGPGGQPAQILRWQEQYPILTKGDNKNIIPAPNVKTPIEIITFDLPMDVKDVVVKVRNYGFAGAFVNKPFSVNEAPGVIYSYSEIEFINLEEGVATEIWLKFKVEREWINDNRIGEDTVVLYRFHDKKWDSLETIQTAKSPEFIHYKAKTPGFSVFAVSGSVSKTGMHLIFEPNISIQRGETQLHTIIVENIGEVALSNVALSVQETLFETKFTPESIAELPVASKGTYLFNLKIPEEASPGTYQSSILVKADEGSTEEFFDIIIPSTAKPTAEALLSDQISSLKSTANKLWLESQWVGLRGGNVSAVFDLITDSKEKLAIAHDNFGMVGLEETRAYTEGASTDLEKAVIKLAEQQPYLSIFKMSPVLIGFIVLVLLVVGFLSYKGLHKFEKTVKESKKVARGDAKMEVVVKETKKSNLGKQLALVEEAYHKKHISKKIYDAEKARLRKKMGK
jgi:PGF-pre-PGF domain-containing protein